MKDNEVYLIKGKCYISYQNSYCVPLSSYGAVEDYLSVDACCTIFPFGDISADVFVFRHQGKWGLFPKRKVTGMGCADWVSDDDKPFLYDDVYLSKTGESDGAYIIVKENGKWGAMVACKDARGNFIYITQCLPSQYESPEEIKSKLNIESVFSISDSERLCVYDDESKHDNSESNDTGNCNPNNNIDILGMVLGFEQYSVHSGFIRAAARHKPSALFLIAKELLIQRKEWISNPNYSSMDDDDPFFTRKDYAERLLKLAEEYLLLSKRYAKEFGNQTIADIVDYYEKYQLEPTKRASNFFLSRRQRSSQHWEIFDEEDMIPDETKLRIINLLKSTNRENIGNVIDYMETKGFFEAPASVDHHNNFEGGLAKHSLEVCEEALMINEKRSKLLPRNSVILCSLLHDICKADQYFIKDGKPGRDDEMCKKGHGKRSMYIVKRCGVPLNYDEEMAIWWHMGRFEPSLKNDYREYNEAVGIELCQMIHRADGISASAKESSLTIKTTKEMVLEALNYVGIDLKDFFLKDGDFTSVNMAHHRKHGMPHIYRVMIAAALIAQDLGKPKEGLLAVCAAYLHDLARETNGGKQDDDHGYYAALNCFGKFENIWRKYNLTDLERDYVRAACAHHSSNRNHNFRYDKIVTNILKDADALDRCRFYEHNRLDMSYIVYKKVCRSLIPLTEAICAPTNKELKEAVSFSDFIDWIG